MFRFKYGEPKYLIIFICYVQNPCRAIVGCYELLQILSLPRMFSPKMWRRIIWTQIRRMWRQRWMWTQARTWRVRRMRWQRWIRQRWMWRKRWVWQRTKMLILVSIFIIFLLIIHLKWRSMKQIFIVDCKILAEMQRLVEISWINSGGQKNNLFIWQNILFGFKMQRIYVDTKLTGQSLDFLQSEEMRRVFFED